MKILLCILVSLLLSGCAAPKLVGTEMWHSKGKLDTTKAEGKTPSYFVLKPEEVLWEFGSKCGGKYWCNIYADESYYFLVPDSLTKACFSTKTCASVIVDGQTGNEISK